MRKMVMVGVLMLIAVMSFGQGLDFFVSGTIGYGIMLYNSPAESTPSHSLTLTDEEGDSYQFGFDQSDLIDYSNTVAGNIKLGVNYDDTIQFGITGQMYGNASSLSYAHGLVGAFAGVGTDFIHVFASYGFSKAYMEHQLGSVEFAHGSDQGYYYKDEYFDEDRVITAESMSEGSSAYSVGLMLTFLRNMTLEVSYSYYNTDRFEDYDFRMWNGPHIQSSSDVASTDIPDRTMVYIGLGWKKPYTAN